MGGADPAGARTNARRPRRRGPADAVRAAWCAILLWLAAPMAFAAEATRDAFPDLADAYLVQVNGKTLWARNADRRLPPASLTKVMTAMLVLEHGHLEDVVAIAPTAAAQRGTRLGLAAGDRIRAADLLRAALVGSANDACYALAQWSAGSASAFVAGMNAKARQLGLSATHFVNPCGFDAPGHLASANDLARLTERALQLPVFGQIVALDRASAHTVDGARTFEVRSTNALLGRLPGAIGVKSGYTARAGKCLIALAERNGVRVLLVMLNARDRWWDAHGVIDRAFEAHSRGG